MSLFTDNSDNITLTAKTSRPDVDALTKPSETVSSPLSRSSSEQDGDLMYPTPETIATVSPGATLTTYKMGGSTGVSGKENQDACSVMTINRNGIKYRIATVCDGHGLYGQKFANHAVSMLPQLVVKNFAQVLAEPVSTLKSLFEQVSSSLEKDMSNKAGGTTATICIFSPGKLICANISDCEALIKLDVPAESISITRNDAVVPAEISNGVIRATVNHNWTNMDEVKRVLNAGASIKYATQARGARELDVFKRVVDADGNETLVQVPHSKQTGGYISNMSREPAVYIRGEYETSINMTRTLGNWDATFVSREPDVTVITWKPDARARLLVASDGYFNCLSRKQQELEMSFDLRPDEICSRGHEAVGKTFGHKYADNTTVVVLE
jgi:serine/threonine protein phosphatase PrpC